MRRRDSSRAVRQEEADLDHRPVLPGDDDLEDHGFEVEEHSARSTRRRLAGCLVPVLILGVVGVGGWQAYVHLENYFGGQSCQLRQGEASEKLSPEQTANAATITSVGVGVRGLPQQAAHIAVTTAIQESKLRNLNSGDRDSLGLFQQRPSQGWGTEEQVTDPVYASGEFYRHLVKVDGWRTRPLTDVAQDVQRSGHPLAYADHEGEGATMAAAAAGEPGTSIGCRLDAAEQPGEAAATARKLRAQSGMRAAVDGRTLTVRADEDSTARMVGAWAVGHAQAEQITEVVVGDRQWTRQRGRDGWDWQAANDPTGSDRAVRITVAD